MSVSPRGEDYRGETLGQTGASAPRVWHGSQVFGWAFGIVLLAGLVVVILHFGEIEQFAVLVQQAQPAWLLLAVLAQACTYVAAAAVWWQALRAAGHPRRLASLVPLGVAKLFIDQAIPSGGISGSMMLMAAFERQRVPLRAGMAALLVAIVSLYIAYLSVVLMSLALVWVHHRTNTATVVIVVMFSALSAAIISTVLVIKCWGGRRLHLWTKRVRQVSVLLEAVSQAPTDLLYNPQLIGKTALLQLTVFLLDCLTLWFIFRSIGLNPDFWVTFVSFVLADATATLAPIPLGLGTFETACTGTLVLLGQSLEAALSATLLLRGLTFWVPMIPGLYLARRELHRAAVRLQD